MPGRLLLATLACLLLVAPAARGAAGEVRIQKVWESDGSIREDYTHRIAQLAYKGDRGRASRLTVRFAGKGRATLRDPRGVRAGKGCRQAGPEQVTCRARGRRPQHDPGARFVLGDGGDVLRLRGLPKGGTAEVDGGAGDDRISGSAGADSLISGAGDDRLSGGRGRDVLEGGSRRNGADDLAGGAGFDELDYAGRSGALHLDLEGDRDDGEPGEGDRLRPGFEQIRGGYGGDEIVGDARRNLLLGYAGADVIRAGDGDDYVAVRGAGSRIEGGGGDDVLSSDKPTAFDGGPGHDVMNALTHAATLSAQDGEADELRCGAPTDASAAVDAFDVVLGCGQIARSGVAAPRFVYGIGVIGETLSTFAARRVFVAHRRLEVLVGCSSDMPSPCAVRVIVRDRDGQLLDQAQTIQPGALGEFSRSIGRKLRADLLRGVYTLRLEGTDAAGAPYALEERDVRAEWLGYVPWYPSY